MLDNYRLPDLHTKSSTRGRALLLTFRTTNRVPRVQQVIIKYIQDLTALVRLVQLVRGHERAGSGGTAGTPGLRASTGARRHLGQTIGRTLAIPRAASYFPA